MAPHPHRAGFRFKERSRWAFGDPNIGKYLAVMFPDAIAASEVRGRIVFHTSTRNVTQVAVFFFSCSFARTAFSPPRTTTTRINPSAGSGTECYTNVWCTSAIFGIDSSSSTRLDAHTVHDHASTHHNLRHDACPCRAVYKVTCK